MLRKYETERLVIETQLKMNESVDWVWKNYQKWKITTKNPEN